MALFKASDLENNKSNMSMIHLRVCQVGKYMYIIDTFCAATGKMTALYCNMIDKLIN